VQYDDVWKAIEEYQKAHNLESRQSSIAIWRPSGVEWRTPPDPPGCYAFYGNLNPIPPQLLYVGKAPRGIGTRLNEHEAHWQKHDGWGRGIALVQQIPVANRWEAASLEEFLIDRLQPPFNRHGRKPRPW
jgi:excinuclease UvrABC nuclease subunit